MNCRPFSKPDLMDDWESMQIDPTVILEKPEQSMYQEITIRKYRRG